jgi:hypothetical protein
MHFAAKVYKSPYYSLSSLSKCILSQSGVFTNPRQNAVHSDESESYGDLYASLFERHFVTRELINGQSDNSSELIQNA